MVVDPPEDTKFRANLHGRRHLFDKAFIHKVSQRDHSAMVCILQSKYEYECIDELMEINFC